MLRLRLSLFLLLGLMMAGLGSAYTPCLAGWTRGQAPFDNYCYKAECGSRPMTWDDAEAVCEGFYQLTWPRLVDVQSSAEGAFVTQLVAGNSACSNSANFTIGLRNFCPNAGYTWASKAHNAYSNWAPGQPQARLPCTLASTSGGTWSTVACGSAVTAAFVCKAPAFGFFPRLPPAGPCDRYGTGWCPMDTSARCYRVYDKDLSWYDARFACKQRYGLISDLVSITTAQEALFVAQLSNMIRPSRPRAWIGANKRMGPEYRSIYAWSDQTPFSFSSWLPGQPNNNVPLKEQSCVAVTNNQSGVAQFGGWNDRVCDERMPFVCKIKTNFPQPTQKPAWFCPAGWSQSPYTSNCYQQINSGPGSPGFTFFTAQTACRALSANGQISDLAGINGPYDQAHANSLLSADSWFGLFAVPPALHFIDQQPVNFRNFAPPADGGSMPIRGCGWIHGKKGVGQWELIDFEFCNKTFLSSALCGMRPSPIAKPPPPSTQNPNCPNGWVFWNGNCYKYHWTTPMSWENADQLCGLGLPTQFGSAHLLSITSMAELDFVVDFTQGQLSSFWIGLSDLATMGSYAWSDGSLFSLQNRWAQRQPNPDMGRCVVMANLGPVPDFQKGNYRKNGSIWYTQDCSSKNAYVCKIPGTRAPVSRAYGFCPKGWVVGSRRCLKPINKYYTGFYNQVQACVTANPNATLASALSAADVRDLISLAGTQRATTNLWIGLCWVDGKFAWASDPTNQVTSLAYANWASGQPNFHNSTSLQCATMDYTGKWSMAQGLNLPYAAICELPKAQTPCATNPCGNGGSCFNQGTNFLCLCPAGVYGNLCQTRDPCLFANPCQNGGSCTSRSGKSPHCKCAAGFVGELCQIPNRCYNNPCQNGGQCRLVGENDNFVCNCSAPFYGYLCQFKANDPCVPNPCANGGMCNATSNSTYKCLCPKGFSGPNCQQKLSPCSSGPCQNGGTCRASGNRYICLCPQGFFGPSCAQRNPCASAPCQHGGQCTATGANSYFCKCLPCYDGPTCGVLRSNCSPCANNPCFHGGTCSPSPSGFTCNCPLHYSGTLCQTLNYCAPNPCRNGAICNPLTGICQCTPGYTGPNCTQPVDLCASNACANGATCISDNTRNTYTCECAPGYQGPHCMNRTNPCSPSQCQRGGTCIPDWPNYQCHCPPFSSGPNCERYDFCGAAGQPCANGGTCSNLGGGFSCSCTSSWIGQKCTLPACTVNIVDNGFYQLRATYKTGLGTTTTTTTVLAFRGSKTTVKAVSGSQVRLSALLGRSATCTLATSICSFPVQITCGGTTLFGFSCDVDGVRC